MSSLHWLIAHLFFGCLFIIHCTSSEQQNGVAIVPDETAQEIQTEQTEPNIRTIDDIGMEAMNPQLIAALREINDDPSYLQQGEGQLVDLSVCIFGFFSWTHHVNDDTLSNLKWIQRNLMK